MNMNEVRPCFVHHQKALWHRWVDKSAIVPPSILRGGHGGGVIAETFALVEFKSGHVKLVSPTEVLFLDSPKKFDEYYWPEPTKED